MLDVGHHLTHSRERVLASRSKFGTTDPRPLNRLVSSFMSLESMRASSEFPARTPGTAVDRRIWDQQFWPRDHEAEAVVTDHDSYDFTIQVGSDFGWVTGTVTTEDGTPVDGSRVYLSGDTLSRDGRVENGEFRFDDIPPGDYTVRVSDTKYDGFSREITVSEGSGTDVSGPSRSRPSSCTSRRTQSHRSSMGAGSTN